MKTLQEIQAEVGAWSKCQFGENVSADPTSPACGAPLGSLPSLLGMIEELGELTRVVARRHQNRSSLTLVAERAAKKDALADLLIFACDYSNREGINLATVLDATWEKVARRRQGSWAADKTQEEAPPGSPGGKVGPDGVITRSWSRSWECPDCGNEYLAGDVLVNSCCVTNCPEAEACGATSVANSPQPPKRRRTRSEVLRARQNAVGSGCCSRFADQMGCDCLAEALPDPPCSHCGGTGLVTCEWGTVKTPCPKCSGGPI